MRKFITTAVVALATLGVAAPTATAEGRHTCDKAYEARVLVKKKHGDRAAGRNICRFGVKHSNGDVVEATRGQKVRYYKHLKALLTPYTAAGKARQRPARVAKPVYVYSIPTYIVMCESRGNWRAVNTSNPNRPAGAYQIITSTWLAYGGGAYAPTADAAAPWQQSIVAARIASGGYGQWECS